jgi:hypothetical protein
MRRRTSLTSFARPAITMRADAAASTASHPAFVTMANAPLAGKGRGELVELICPTAKAKYFLKEDWTTQISLNLFMKFEFSRGVFQCDCQRE